MTICYLALNALSFFFTSYITRKVLGMHVSFAHGWLRMIEDDSICGAGENPRIGIRGNSKLMRTNNRMKIG